MTSVQYASFRKITPAQVETKVAFATCLLKAGTPWALTLLRIMARSLVALPPYWRTYASDLWACVKDMEVEGAVNVSYYVNAKNETRLVMFSSHNDGVLIKLAKRCGFPRGCVVVWTGDNVQLRGFYPKFENADVTNVELVSASLTLKISGFLGHAVAFEDGGKVWWTACSKNSADDESLFVKRARRVMEPYMTPALVTHMAKEAVYVGGECLDPEDNTHGYVVPRSKWVVTCVGHASVQEDLMMCYMDGDAMYDFCVRFGLPCSDLVRMEGPRTLELLRELLPSEKRDMMLYADLAARLPVARRGHLFDHAVDVGNVLEGLVIRMTTAKGLKYTIKYKLPHYTWRTFMARAVLQPFVGGAFAARVDKYHQAMEEYVGRWCSTGRGFFRMQMKGLFVLLQNEAVEASTHVKMAERLLVASQDSLEAWAKVYDEMLGSATVVEMKSASRVRAVLVTGPVGSGKTEFARRLVERLGKAGVMVDGDQVADDKTQLLGVERNLVTCGAITRVWRDGLIAVICMGGGALTRGNDEVVECFLPELVQREFEGAELELTSVVMIPAAGRMMMEWTLASHTSLPVEFFERVVHDRLVERKVWTTRVTGLEMYERSLKNVKHTEAIQRVAQRCLCAPFVADKTPQDTYDSIAQLFVRGGNVGTLLVKPLLQGWKREERRSLVHQVRDLVLVDQKEMKHVTRLYSAEGVAMTNGEIDALSPMDLESTGDWVTLMLGERKISFVVLSDGGHITMSPGCFAPKDMALAAAWWLSRDGELALVEKKTKQTFVIKELVEATAASGGKDGTPFKRGVPANYGVRKGVSVVRVRRAVALGREYAAPAFMTHATKRAVKALENLYN